MPQDIAMSTEPGPLANLVARMAMPSHASAPRIWFLGERSPRPHAPPPDPFDNEPIVVQQLDGTYVGIGRIVEEDYTHLLCSDSFAPSVPVIIIKQSSILLAHCNGVGRAPELRALRDGGVVIVVRKKNYPRQAMVADKLVELLEERAAQVLVRNVDPPGAIGVVVYGQTKTVIIYQQI